MSEVKYYIEAFTNNGGPVALNGPGNEISMLPASLKNTENSPALRTVAIWMIKPKAGVMVKLIDPSCNATFISHE